MAGIFANTNSNLHFTRGSIMQNFLMILASTGLFYTALSSTLYDMTVTACESQIGNYELACKEVNK